MLKSKLNVLTLKKDPLPTVVFHEPEDIELRSTTPLPKNRAPTGYKVAYLGKVTVSGSHFLSGCTESAVAGLWEGRARGDAPQADALLEIRPFQVRLRPLDERGGASVAAETHQVSRIAYCTADHGVSPAVFAWIYRRIDDDLTFRMDCHAVECASKVEAKRLAHAMMEAFRQTLQRMHSEGRISAPADAAPAPADG
ncbi:PTB-containing, cubilin and LRP1-interacting protein-like isoform X2 [Conger conger]|nr:PTB-containing, cubilin and LRP1-interacting protein-like isoform X2 [Conger conger]